MLAWQLIYKRLSEVKIINAEDYPFTSCLQSACWAMAKSWLDVQVDLELVRLQPGGVDQFKGYEDAIENAVEQVNGSNEQIVAPDNWPLQVLHQQPRHLPALLQKLHSR